MYLETKKIKDKVITLETETVASTIFCVYRTFWSFLRKFMLLEILNHQSESFSREIESWIKFQNAKVFSP